MLTSRCLPSTSGEERAKQKVTWHQERKSLRFTHHDLIEGSIKVLENWFAKQETTLNIVFIHVLFLPCLPLQHLTSKQMLQDG